MRRKEKEVLEERVLKALCEPKRFLLLRFLSEGGCCVRTLARKCRLSESAVSQHLKVMREADLVYGVKKGYYTLYCLNKETLGKVIEAFLSLRNAVRKDAAYSVEESEALDFGKYLPMTTKEKEDRS